MSCDKTLPPPPGELPEWRVVCAWCGKHLRGPADAGATSHGICEACAAAAWAETHQGTNDAVEAGLVPDRSVWGHWVDLGGEG